MGSWKTPEGGVLTPMLISHHGGKHRIALLRCGRHQRIHRGLRKLRIRIDEEVKFRLAIQGPYGGVVTGSKANIESQVDDLETVDVQEV